MINLLERFNGNSKILSLIKDLKSNKNCSCFGLNFNEISFLMKMIDNQKILVVTSPAEAFKYSSQLESLGLKTMVLLNKLENYTFSIFEETENMQNLTLSLFKLLTKQINVLIVLDKVLIQKVINPSKFSKLILTLKCDEEIDFEDFKNELFSSGYKRVEVIAKKGEFSVRGDILSVFPINFDYPVRISFFDNLIERISLFSLESFEVLKDEKEIQICPVNLLFELDSTKSVVLEKIKNAQIKSNDDKQRNQLNSLYSEIDNLPSKRINSQFILPFLDDFNSSVLDYLSGGIVIYIEPKIIFSKVVDEMLEANTQINSMIFEGRLLEEHRHCLVDKQNVFKSPNTNLAFLNLNTANKIFESQEVYSFLSSFLKNYNNNFNFLLDDVKNFMLQKKIVILCADNNEKALKLEEFLRSSDRNCSVITSLNQIKDYGIYIFVSQILNGVNFVEDGIIFVGNFNIYGQKKIIETDAKIKKVFFTPKTGDYVVHDTFGICVCKKIEKIEFNGVEKDYYVLEFSGGDLLYLPSEKANLISKYVGETESPKLNKLGTDEFNKEKQKVKAKVKELAFNLIELYAKRNKIKGYCYQKDDIVQKEFEDAFPYPLTPDQQKAVDDIKRDMESEKTMDRLVCGDVGYGKTEVAMRAIFKAILSGKQVAFLCPTTILCEQHYKTCLARMQSFMVNVQSLSRFKSNKEVKTILQKLSSGEINLICGTHRLLSNDVVFKDLGLLVLDEEQRFGVSDKEKIKNLKQNIDVLTLSATPIPRTLNMSLIGVRDISIIDTPPKNRVPVQSIVTEYSPNLVKDAIQKELNRGGQVLIVYNRVETINQFAKTIQDYFPNNVVKIAHGQMDKKSLENVIMEVYNEQVQILVSTVLIENGIDLPKANTIIITSSDKLGLSQLYQLRGRVGRSDRDAYAYFTYDSNKSLTEEGYKRLSALSEFSSMGSGFKIAMRDLEIRGAGSIFGAEQSGHIEKVGIDMYNKLLKEAVSELKGAKQKTYRDLKVEVLLDCFIPKNFIESEDNRFEIYEQIASLQNLKQLDDLVGMLDKKFGEVPCAVKNLCSVAVLKNILLNYGAKRLVVNLDKCFIEFYDKDCVDNEKMLEILSKNKKIMSLKFRTLPIIEFNLTGEIISKINRIINIFINS